MLLTLILQLSNLIYYSFDKFVITILVSFSIKTFALQLKWII
jgi:hypothetical protein